MMWILLVCLFLVLSHRCRPTLLTTSTASTVLSIQSAYTLPRMCGGLCLCCILYNVLTSHYTFRAKCTRFKCLAEKGGRDIHQAHLPPLHAAPSKLASTTMRPCCFVDAQSTNLAAGQVSVGHCNCGPQPARAARGLGCFTTTCL